MKGHIRKRGKKWCVVIEVDRDVDGKRRQRWHSGYRTKREAEDELARLLNQRREGTYVEPNKTTVGEYLDLWLDTYARPAVATKTYVRYAEICKHHLTPALGHHRLLKLQPMHIEVYYAQALKSGRLDGKGGLSAQTVKHHHRILSEALSRAVKWRILVQNPATAVDPPSPEKKEMRALTTGEIQTLLGSAQEASETLDGEYSGRLYIPILLAVTTGLRRGELLALRWKDIDGTRLAVRRSVERTTLEGTKFKQPKTAKSARSVALPSLVIEALNRHKTEQKKERLLLGRGYQDSDQVICHPDGSLWDPHSFTAAFRRFASDLDIGHFRFHDLRHSHATQLLTAGVHPKVVSERLGHSSIGITLDTYSHVLPGMQEEAAEKVDQLLRTPATKEAG